MSSVVRTPDSRPAARSAAWRPWCVLVAFAAMQALATVSIYTALGINLPLMVRDEHWNWTEAGFGFTVVGACIGGSSYLPAILIRRFGVRVALLLGTVLTAAGLAAFSATHGLGLYLIGAALCGVGYQMMAQIPASHVLTALFHRRSTALGLYMTFSSGLGAAGPLAVLGALHLFHDNWRLVWASETVIALLIGSVCALVMGGPAWLARASAALEARIAAHPPKVHAARRVRDVGDWTLAAAMRTPQFYVLLAAYFGHVICMATTASFAMAHLTQRGVSPIVVGSMLSLEALAGMVWRFLAGVLGDIVDPKYLLVFALAALVVGMAALSVAQDDGALIVFAIGTGIGFTVTALAIMLLLQDYYGRTRNLEIFSTICTIGALAALGPTYGGVLRDKFGGFSFTFQSFALLNAAVLAAALFMRPPARRSASGLTDTASLDAAWPTRPEEDRMTTPSPDAPTLARPPVAETGALSLPIIDMQTYRSGDPQAKIDLIEAIAAKSQTLGFFYLVNHGLPPALLDRQLDWARRFFALPLQDKQAVDFRNLPVRRGYEPMALQTLQAGAPPDQKEGFTFGLDPRPDASPEESPFEGPNQWPARGPGFDAEGFQAQMEAYRDAMVGLGRELCGLIAASLDLPEDYFAKALAKPNASVRVLHYPPRAAQEADDRLGCGAHTDWGFITLLLQDDCGGLEIEVKDGGWLKAAPLPGALIINLGDMVVRLTAGRYASNVHRVLNTAPGKDRYSVATFFNPHSAYKVECVPSCIPPSGSPEPITFSDHIQEMIRKTYAA